MTERPLALVTGASNGFGAEFVRRLAAEGHDVAKAGKPFAVHTARWKTLAFASRFVPRTTMARMARDAQRRVP